MTIEEVIETLPKNGHPAITQSVKEMLRLCYERAIGQGKTELEAVTKAVEQVNKQYGF